jgi:hypothetical protein
MIDDRYGVHLVEFEHFHFAETRKAYFTEVNDRMKRQNRRWPKICLEFGDLNISAPRVLRAFGDHRPNQTMDRPCSSVELPTGSGERRFARF